jgi:DNA-binding transcriptional ArsR family regulator
VTERQLFRAAQRLAAGGHPLRLRILSWGAERTTFTSTDLATAFDAPLENVSYHVRFLRDAKLLNLKRQVPVRATVERHYEVTPAGRRLLDAARTAL